MEASEHMNDYVCVTEDVYLELAATLERRYPGKPIPMPRGWHCHVCGERTLLDRVYHLVVRHGWNWPGTNMKSTLLK